jgi:hypothetical protein
MRVTRNQKGCVAGYNGQLVVTADHVTVGVMLSPHPVARTLCGQLVTCGLAENIRASATTATMNDLHRGKSGRVRAPW